MLVASPTDPSVMVATLERRTRLILQCAGEGIYGLDLEGNTTFVNPAAAAMLGWSPDDLMGLPQHALIHHSHPDGGAYAREECPIYAAFTDGAVHVVNDEVFWRKDGSSFPVEYTSTPIHDDSGELAGAVVTFRNITERKKAKAELLAALAEVERLKEELEAENRYLRAEVEGPALEAMIGDGEAMSAAKQQVQQVAPTDATVLLLGETGVGKELFARAVHGLSSRRDRALIKLNCATLPSSLIESELFGHEKGAFTGASTRRVGRFELAHQGTIFLDEIGELPLALQAKLLRVLQEGEIERLGGTQTIEIDIRVIAATNRDLLKMVWAGDFREDLYYRLNVFPVAVPPLRGRAEDVPALAEHFVQKFSRKLGRVPPEISEHAHRALREYAWPGNIRELENVIERALILSTDGTLPVQQALEPRSSELPAPAAPPVSTEGRTLEEVERAHVRATIEKSGWRIDGERGAAKVLGLHPNTLRSRMKKLGIRRGEG